MEKIFLILLVVFSSSASCFAQNILEALEFKASIFEAYSEGELSATDSIIDLRNGYYEAFYSETDYDEDEKIILHQAAIFNNADGSKMLGVSTCEWDFACFEYGSNFYEISESVDAISEISLSDVLPEVSIEDFISDPKVYEISAKYLTVLQGGYLAEDAEISDLLSEIYTIHFIIPQKGTTLLAKLATCDYIPLNEIEISAEDWELLTQGLPVLEFKYDTVEKRFVGE